MIYILKIKGITGKSDYIQIRDNNFTLLSYFRFENIHNALVDAGLEEHEDIIKNVIIKADYGKMQKLQV